MNGTFEETIRSFSEKDQLKIRKNLTRWKSHPVGVRIARNIEDECHLIDLDVFKSLLSIFIKRKSNYLRDFKKHCNENNWFKGRDILDEYRPQIVGRVLSRHRFDNLMWENYHMTTEDVDDLMYKVRKKSYKTC